jgi:hypothetical protein
VHPQQHRDDSELWISRGLIASLITSDDSDIITVIGIELNGSRSCFVVIE